MPYITQSCHRKQVNVICKWHLWTNDNFTNILLSSYFSKTLIGLLIIWRCTQERYSLMKWGSEQKHQYVETLLKAIQGFLTPCRWKICLVLMDTFYILWSTDKDSLMNHSVSITIQSSDDISNRWKPSTIFSVKAITF